MTASALHVLVIGGGLGGLCLARALRNAGVSVAVYERDHRMAAAQSDHYSLQINAWGNRALHACLLDELWAAYLAMAGQPLAGMRFVTEQLRPLLSVDWPLPASPAEATWRVSRPKLRQILLAGLEDIVHPGKRFVRFESTPDARVTAHFDDGTSALGDVLVGADGVASNVRKQLLPQARVQDLHVAAIGAKLPLEHADRLGWSALVGNRLALALPPRGGGMFVTQFAQRRPPEAFTTDRLELCAPDLEDHVFWALIARRASFGSPGDLRRLSAEELRELALNAARVWSPTLRQLISKSAPRSFTTISLQTSQRIPNWQTGRVTLLGDAVHTMTPLQGLGGNTALRDAQLLSRHLVAAAREGRPLLLELRAYETTMRDYAVDAVRVSLQYTEQFVSENVLARAAFKGVLRMADRAPILKERWFSPTANPGSTVGRLRSGA